MEVIFDGKMEFKIKPILPLGQGQIDLFFDKKAEPIFISDFTSIHCISNLHRYLHQLGSKLSMYVPIITGLRN